MFHDPKHNKLIEKIIRDFLSGKQTWQVDVFGSRRRGDHRTYSDLDLWIETTPGLLLVRFHVAEPPERQRRAV